LEQRWGVLRGRANLLDVAEVKQALPRCGEALARPSKAFVQAVGDHELRPRSVMGAQVGQ
jgi:hypothetical protein